jgi:hypothetical protein
VRFSIFSVSLAGAFWLAGVFAPPAALAGPNVPLCLAMQNNFNKCVRHQRAREQRRRWEAEHSYGYYEDRPPWERHHRRHSGEDCNAWLLQLKANGCF